MFVNPSLARMDVCAPQGSLLQCRGTSRYLHCEEETGLPVLALGGRCCVTLGMCPHLSDRVPPHLRKWPVRPWTPPVLLLFGFLSPLACHEEGPAPLPTLTCQGASPTACSVAQLGVRALLLPHPTVSFLHLLGLSSPEMTFVQRPAQGAALLPLPHSVRNRAQESVLEGASVSALLRPVAGPLRRPRHPWCPCPAPELLEATRAWRGAEVPGTEG